jgi:protein-S-isoprenylcysteine O-methyltransferase Ste14
LADATRRPKHRLRKKETRKPIPAREVVFGSLVFPLLVVGVFSGVDVWWRSPRLTSFPWNILGVPILLGGLALGAWCLQTVWRMPPGVTLLTWGPWGLSRHPIYLAGQLVNLGITLLVGTLALFIGLALHVFLDRLASRLEERGLRRHLGSRYAAYAEAVPRWLPRFPHSRSAGP